MPPSNNKKRKRLANDVPVKISVAPQPTNVALPPPLVPYHPHLVPSYYPVYHQHPYFLQVGPQPPISPSLSPTLPSTTSPTNTATTTTNNNNENSTTTASTTSTSQRILPKSPTPTHPTLAPTYNYFPYPIQVSPQLHPTAGSPLQAQPQPHPGSISPMPFQPVNSTPHRNSSVSSITTTADQREQARKVSHSAIERRRRERINDKILQLKELIPACADRENLHKMTILQSAIDYITYLKKVVEDIDTTGSIQQSAEAAIKTSNPTKSMLPKEVEPFTHQFSVSNKPDDDEDSWSTSSSPKPPVTPLPTSGLKPMDLIKLNKRSSPPRIVIHEHHSDDSSHSIDRNMNLENILC